MHKRVQFFCCQRSLTTNYINYKSLFDNSDYIDCNRCPIAFKGELRDSEVVIPEGITPEQLLHGFVLPSVNIIPSIQATDFQGDENYDPVGKVKDVDAKLRNIRTKLIVRAGSYTRLVVFYFINATVFKHVVLEKFILAVHLHKLF